MRWNEISPLSEAIDIGPNMSHIEDLRVPGYRSPMGRRVKNKAGELAYADGPPASFVVLTKGEGALLYNWAAGNKIAEWRELHDHVMERMDTTVQTDMTTIMLYRNGFLISEYPSEKSWGGKRTKHSVDMLPILKALVERGIADKRTPIWLGNWAAREGDSVGSIGKLIDRLSKKPTRLTMYHGTSNYRAEKIMQDGLTPMSASERVWSRDRKSEMPEHRANSVYLTASIDQAKYYARKAVNVDRARGNRPSGWDFEPVILKVTLGAADLRKLLADDDHLRNHPDADVADWHDSLSRMAQVAYRGSIPPNRLSIIKPG